MLFSQKYKESIFPDIKDFSSAQDELRNKPVNNMSIGEFLWFSPFAYKLVSILIVLVFACAFLVMAFVSVDIPVVFWMFIGCAVVMIYKLIKIVISGQLKIDTNLYDMFIREDKNEGGVKND